jgi:hypothetical protein
MFGYAPDPDASGGAEQVLHEDARWKYPLSGNLIDVSDNDGEGAIKKYNLHGGLIIDHVIAASVAALGDTTIDGALVLGKPYFCSLYNSNDITLSTSVPTVFTFNTERYNYGGMHSLTTNTSRVTFPRAGLAIFAGNAIFAANSTGIRQIYIELNGSAFVNLQLMQAVATPNSSQINVSGMRLVAAGDYIELGGQQSSGGNLNITAAAEYSPSFAVLLIPTA